MPLVAAAISRLLAVARVVGYVSAVCTVAYALASFWGDETDLLGTARRIPTHLAAVARFVETGLRLHNYTRQFANFTRTCEVSVRDMREVRNLYTGSSAFEREFMDKFRDISDPLIRGWHNVSRLASRTIAASRNADRAFLETEESSRKLIRSRELVLVEQFRRDVKRTRDAHARVRATLADVEAEVVELLEGMHYLTSFVLEQLDMINDAQARRGQGWTKNEIFYTYALSAIAGSALGAGSFGNVVSSAAAAAGAAAAYHGYDHVIRRPADIEDYQRLYAALRGVPAQLQNITLFFDEYDRYLCRVVETLDDVVAACDETTAGIALYREVLRAANNGSGATGPLAGKALGDAEETLLAYVEALFARVGELVDAYDSGNATVAALN